MRKTSRLLAAGAVLSVACVATSSTYAFAAAPDMIDVGKKIEIPFSFRHASHSQVKNAGAGVASVSTVKRTVDRRAALRATSGGSVIYAYLGDSSEKSPVGLYSLDGEEYNLKWADPYYQSDGMALITGWYADGRLCGFAPEYLFGYVMGVKYAEFDLEGGELMLSRNADTASGVMSVTAYNSDEGKIYGFGDNPVYGASFMSADVATPDKPRVIKSLANNPSRMCVSLAYAGDTKTLYGVNLDLELVELASDGTQTKIMDLTGIEPTDFICGMTYSDSEKALYWNYISADASELYVIKPVQQQMEIVAAYDTDINFPFLINPGISLDPATPLKPELAAIGFEGGATEGTINYRLPVETFDGSSLSGTIEWIATVDRTEAGRGTGAPGEVVTVGFKGLSEGMHTFGCSVIANGFESDKVVSRFYVGNDIPQAPANVTLTSEAASWQPVTKGINDGYVDVSAIEYEVVLNGVSLGSTSATSMPVAYPEDAPVCAYEVSVTATCNGRKSEPGQSNTFVTGKPLTPDVAFAPTEAEAKLFTLIDVGNDGNTWFYDPYIYDTTGFNTDFDPLKPMDDWLILPPIEFSSVTHYYKFAMDARRKGNSAHTDDFFEVWIGSAPSPEAMQRKIISKTKPEYHLDWNDWSEYATTFKVEGQGVYYIGIRSVSDADQYGQVVRNIRVTDTGITDSFPGEVTEVSAAGAANGELAATVTFRMPSAYMSGIAIPESTQLTAKVASAVDETLVTGVPGELKEVKVGTEQGINRIGIVVIIGSDSGVPVETEVYTGVVIPGAVREMTATVADDLQSVSLAWLPPLEGQDGGYIDASKVSYRVYTYDESYGWINPVKVDENVCSYEFRVSASTPQDIFRIGVSAENVAGVSSAITSVSAVLGQLYTLPMSEDFEGENPEDPFSINPWSYYTPDDGYKRQRWSVEKLSAISSDWADETSAALMGTSSVDGGKGKIGVPRFTAAGMGDMQLVLDVWTGRNAAKASVTAIANGMDEEVVIGTVAPGSGWRKTIISIPAEFDGKGWIQLYLIGEYASSSDMLLVDGLKVSGVSASLSDVALGRGSVIGGIGRIVVSNMEQSAIKAYTVDGRVAIDAEVASPEATFAVAPGIYIVSIDGKSVKVTVR